MAASGIASMVAQGMPVAEAEDAVLLELEKMMSDNKNEELRKHLTMAHSYTSRRILSRAK